MPTSLLLSLAAWPEFALSWDQAAFSRAGLISALRPGALSSLKLPLCCLVEATHLPHWQVDRHSSCGAWDPGGQAEGLQLRGCPGGGHCLCTAWGQGLGLKLPDLGPKEGEGGRPELTVAVPLHFPERRDLPAGQSEGLRWGPALLRRLRPDSHERQHLRPRLAVLSGRRGTSELVRGGGRVSPSEACPLFSPMMGGPAGSPASSSRPWLPPQPPPPGCTRSRGRARRCGGSPLCSHRRVGTPGSPWEDVRGLFEEKDSMVGGK